MTRGITLKLSLLGAVLSLGAIAKNDVQSKHMKDQAEFTEKAAMISKTQVNISELALSQSSNPQVKQFAEKVISDHHKAFNSLKEIAIRKGYSLPFSSIGSGVSDASSSSATHRTNDMKGDTENAAGNAANDVSNDVKSAGEDVKSASKQTAGDVTGSSPVISSSKEYTKANEKVQKEYNDLAKLSGEKFDKEWLSDINSANDKAIKLVEKATKDGWDSDLMNWANETLPTLRQHEEMAKSLKNDLKNTKPTM